MDTDNDLIGDPCDTNKDRYRASSSFPSHVLISCVVPHRVDVGKRQALQMCSFPVMAMVTKTLGTTAQLSSTAPSWTPTKMEKEMNVTMMMTTMVSQTCFLLVPTTVA